MELVMNYGMAMKYGEYSEELDSNVSKNFIKGGNFLILILGAFKQLFKMLKDLNLVKFNARFCSLSKNKRLVVVGFL
jgi:hypothetical protein